jgi:ELWxxDGT repeat protein
MLRILTDVNGMMYFVANDGIHGDELWRSDGTADGTHLVADLTPGINSTLFHYREHNVQVPSDVLPVGDLLFFTAGVRNSLGDFDNSLFVTDGTSAGTRPLITFENSGFGPPPISELTYTGSHLFFRGLVQFDVEGVTYSRYGLYALAVVPEATALSLIGTALLCIIAFAPRRQTSRSTFFGCPRVDDGPARQICGEA